MHNGMLRFTGEKMSKSLGNVDDDPRGARHAGAGRPRSLFFLTAHWRKPIDFSDETMTAAAGAGRDAPQRAAGRDPLVVATGTPFDEALEDDFNTPAALAILHEWARTGALEELRRGLDVFGLGSLAERAQAPPEVVTLADARIGARASRDFAEADRLRDEIAEHGWEVRDVASGYELVPRT